MTYLTEPRIARTAQELQRAHDILISVLLMEPQVRARILGTDDANLRAAMATTDVLCWALGHSHNKTFEEDMKTIEETLVKLGVVVYDMGYPVPGEERSS